MRKGLKSNLKSLIKESAGKPVTNLTEFQIRKLMFSKYKLSLLLKKELINESTEKGTISNKINNEILINKYRIFEVKNNNSIYLHKGMRDYYIVLRFKQRKLKIDSRKMLEIKNESIKQMKSKMNIKSEFYKIFNFEKNIEMRQIEDSDYYKNLGEGDLVMEKENFEIDIINKDSECIRYYCSIEFNEITIAFIKYINNYEEDKGLLYMNDYHGPEFDSLNPVLQKQFLDLLESLSIYPDIAKYIKYLGLNKNKRNYIKFLSNFNNLLI